MDPKLAEMYGTVPNIMEKLAMLKQAADAGEVDLDGTSAADLLASLEEEEYEDDHVKLAEEKAVAADQFGRMMAQQEFSEHEVEGYVEHTKTASAGSRIRSLLGIE